MVMRGVVLGGPDEDGIAGIEADTCGGIVLEESARWKWYGSVAVVVGKFVAEDP